MSNFICLPYRTQDSGLITVFEGNHTGARLCYSEVNCLSQLWAPVVCRSEWSHYQQLVKNLISFNSWSKMARSQPQAKLQRPAVTGNSHCSLCSDRFFYLVYPRVTGQVFFTGPGGPSTNCQLLGCLGSHFFILTFFTKEAP